MIVTQYQVATSAQVDIGARRPTNEDAVDIYFPSSSAQLETHGVFLAVADGVGNLPQSHQASQHAIQHGIKAYYQQIPSDPPRIRLLNTVEIVNQYVRSIYPNGATTLTIAVVLCDQLYVIHIGDTRCYLVRGQNCLQITQDHVRKDGKKSRLARAIGQRATVVADYYQETLQPKDRIIMVTDGATRYLDCGDFVRIVSTATDTKSVADRIIAESKQAGGIDNIGVVVGQIYPSDVVLPSPVPEPEIQSINSLPVTKPEITSVPSKPQYIDDIPVSTIEPDTAETKRRLPPKYLLVVITLVIVAGVGLAASGVLPILDAHENQLQAIPTQSTHNVIDDTTQGSSTNSEPSADTSNNTITSTTISASSENPTIADPSSLQEGMKIAFGNSAITYVRIDDDTAAFTLKPETSYQIYTIYTDRDQVVWYRLQDPSTGKRGWIQTSDLPLPIEIRD